MKTALVPEKIDRHNHRHVLKVWNESMANCETLEMVWPKLVAAIRLRPPEGNDAAGILAIIDAMEEDVANYAFLRDYAAMHGEKLVIVMQNGAQVTVSADTNPSRFHAAVTDARKEDCRMPK